MRPLNVLGVGSSMRAGSYGTKTLKVVLITAQKHEARTRLIDLSIIRMPMFNPDLSMQPDKEIQKGDR